MSDRVILMCFSRWSVSQAPNFQGLINSPSEEDTFILSKCPQCLRVRNGFWVHTISWIDMNQLTTTMLHIFSAITPWIN